MLKTIFTAFLLITASFTAQADFSAAEKKELNKLIEAYIIEHPEIVRESLIRLAEAEAVARRENALSIVRNDAGDPFMGAGDNADIIIYEFSDYNCGYCKRVFGQLQAVLAEDDKVRLTLKEFPILSETSIIAAKAAIAAHRQGKFPEFHSGMMNWRGQVSLDMILSIAAENGLDVGQLEAEMNSPDIDKILNRTRAAAQALEISGTPALVIGTEVVPGAVTAAEIKSIIAAQRAAQSG